MSNLKFTLFVEESECPGLGTSLFARVFDYESFCAVDRAIQNGVFGHYSKKRYFLVPLEKVLAERSKQEYPGEMIPVCDLEPRFQIYPKGGRLINPLVLGIYAFDKLTFSR